MPLSNPSTGGSSSEFDTDDSFTSQLFQYIIESSETLSIPLKFRLITYEEYVVRGTLTLDGELRVISY